MNWAEATILALSGLNLLTCGILTLMLRAARLGRLEAFLDQWENPVAIAPNVRRPTLRQAVSTPNPEGAPPPPDKSVILMTNERDDKILENEDG